VVLLRIKKMFKKEKEKIMNIDESWLDYIMDRNPIYTTWQIGLYIEPDYNKYSMIHVLENSLKELDKFQQKLMTYRIKTFLPTLRDMIKEITEPTFVYMALLQFPDGVEKIIKISKKLNENEDLKEII